MHPLGSLILENLRTIGARPYPAYEAILGNALDDAPPPFYKHWFGRRYFELSRDADWFAQSLIANAALEGYGATQIWKFSNKVADSRYVPAIRRHALDESRHSSIFIYMLRLVFPTAVIDAHTEQVLGGLQPHYSPRDHPPTLPCSDDHLLLGEPLLNELIQVHITEIRALVLQYLLRPVLLAYGSPSVLKQLTGFTGSLIRDESRHIDYTARIFEAAARPGMRDFLFEAFKGRLRDFNDLTMVELEREHVAI